MSTVQFVEQLYQNILGRTAETGGRTYWVQQIDSGVVSGLQATRLFLDSREFSDKVSHIALLYYTVLDRIPDASGLQYWMAQAQKGVSLMCIDDAFVSSTEFQSKYANLSDSAFLDKLYLNAFDRTADEGGKSYWLNQLSQGVTRSDIVLAFSQSSEQLNAKEEQIKIIAEYCGILNTAPTQTQIDAAIAQADPLATLASLYRSSHYSGVDVPGLDSTPYTISGVVSDGYIANASVFADANGDGLWQEGEAQTTSDSQGHFRLSNGIGAIVVSGGTDINTGKIFTGVLTAPAGSTTVTPLTTLQQSLKDTGLSTAEAAAKLGLVLGFDASVIDLQSYDPISAAVSGSSSSADIQLAVSLQATAAKLENLLVTAASTLVGAAGGTSNLSMSSALAAVVASLSASLASASTKISFGDTGFVEKVLTQAVTLSNNAALIAASGVVASLAGNYATIEKALADKIDAVAMSNDAPMMQIGRIVQVQALALGALSDALLNSAASNTFNNVTQTYSGTSLETQVLATKISDIQPNSEGDSTNIAIINGYGGSSGGGNGGTSPFTVTENPTTHILEFSGSATGAITMAMVDATHATFTRNGNTTASIDLTTVVGIDLPTNAITIDSAIADKLRSIGTGIKFAADDAITLADTGANLAALTFANYKTSVLGGASVTLDATDNTVSLTKAQADSLSTSGLKFAGTDAITLTDTGANLAALTFANYKTSVLGGASVILDASDNTVSLTKAQADSLTTSGLKFAANDVVTLADAGANLAALTFANYTAAALGVTSVTLDATDNTVSLTKAQADSLTTSGLKFAADDAITLADTGANLAGLTFANYTATALGVSSVALDATDNTVSLTKAQADSLISSGLKFAADDAITLADTGANLAGLTFANYTATALGVSSVALDATDNTVSLTKAEADSLISSCLKFVGTDTVTLSDTGANLAALTFGNYKTSVLGGTSVKLDASNNVATLTQAEATALVSSGLTFATSDALTLAVDAAGTAFSDAAIQGMTYSNYSTTQLGGSAVLLKSDGAIELTTAHADAMRTAGIKLDSAAVITLTADESGTALADATIQGLTCSNFSTSKLGGAEVWLKTDGAITLTSTQANAIFSAGLQFVAGATVTVNGSPDNDTIVTLGNTGNTLTISHIERLIGGTGSDTVTLSDEGGSVLVEGVEFLIGGAGTDNVTLGDGGNSITMRGIETLTGGAGVDTVTLGNTGNTLTISRVERIMGGTGADIVLLGAEGGSVLVGGVEFLIGGAGTDNVTLSDGGNTITMRGIETLTGGAGTDIVILGDVGNTLTVTGVEFLIGGAGTDNVTLGDGGNSITVRGIEMLTGGAGVDTVTLGNSGNTITVTGVEGLLGGTGNDVVILGDSISTVDLKDGNDTVVLGSNANVVTLGSGNDVVKFSVGKDEDIYSSVTDFSIGDTLDFGLASAGTLADKSTLGAGVSLNGTPSFLDYLNASSAGNGGVNSLLAWFQFDGNTYIVLDCSTNSSFQAGVDGVLKIVGLTDLSDAVLSGEVLSMTA